MSTHLIYIATNRVTGDQYIGATKKTLNGRRSQHEYDAWRSPKRGCGRLWAAIRKYGEPSFDWEIARICASLTDAMLKEQELIREYRPAYNITAGGRGLIGAERTAEWLANMSAAMKGHPSLIGSKRRVGKKHSERTKAQLRALGLDSRERWKEFSHMGPKASARKVICLSDGRIYESASAAARAYGVAKSALIELCLGKKYRKTVGGRVFRYLDEVSETNDGSVAPNGQGQGECAESSGSRDL